MTKSYGRDDEIDELRRDQIEEARRLAEHDGEPPRTRRTLTARPGFTAPKKPSKPIRGNAVKGHEAFLKDLEDSQARVRIEKRNGDIIVGTIRHSDKFTITVRSENTEFDDAGHQLVIGAAKGYSDRVIYKHDISEFSALTPRPVTAEEEMPA